MDERHTQIREGAGRDEARLNIEFIEFLRKWSTPLLVIIALIALGYFGLQKLRERRESALTAAFTQLEAADSAGNPVGLLAVADEHAGQAAVSQIARLRAADIYLDSSRSGRRDGAELPEPGQPEDATAILTEEERAQQLSKAAELYQRVVSDTTGKANLVQHTIGGLYGLAAVAESRGNTDEARRHLDAIESLAQANDMPEHVELAKQRLDSLPTLANVPKLYTKAELPAAPSTLPDGVRQVPNPFANQTPVPAPDASAPPVPAEPAGPPAPTPVEPETSGPGATPPDVTPAGEKPAETPEEKPAEKPADPPKDKP